MAIVLTNPSTRMEEWYQALRWRPGQYIIPKVLVYCLHNFLDSRVKDHDVTHAHGNCSCSKYLAQPGCVPLKSETEACDLVFSGFVG